jgi:23S rRNA (guanosine2251-2'-O)-methyltransferase
VRRSGLPPRRDTGDAPDPAGPGWVYGRQPVLECLRAGRRECLGLVIADGVRDAGIAEILSAASARGLTQETAPSGSLDALAAGGHHQGVALKAGPYRYEDFGAFLRSESGSLAPLVLLLDHVQDPQNLGALLRAAEGAGVRGVVLPTDRACAVTSAVVRASAGAAEHVRVATVTNLVRSMEQLKEAGFWIAGLDMSPAAKLCHETDLTGPLALVAGAEGGGLGRLVRERCDFLVRLPMLGRVASLNVAAATAIALYEARRQQTAAAAATRAAAAAGSASGSSESPRPS